MEMWFLNPQLDNFLVRQITGRRVDLGTVYLVIYNFTNRLSTITFN